MLSTAFWLQNRSWDAAQAGRHALDRQGRQRHHLPALQQAQRTLPGFLGTPLRAKAAGCMTSLNLMCARVSARLCGRAQAESRAFARQVRYYLSCSAAFPALEEVLHESWFCRP